MLDRDWPVPHSFTAAPQVLDPVFDSSRSGRTGVKKGVGGAAGNASLGMHRLAVQRAQPSRLRLAVDVEAPRADLAGRVPTNADAPSRPRRGKRNHARPGPRKVGHHRAALAEAPVKPAVSFVGGEGEVAAVSASLGGPCSD